MSPDLNRVGHGQPRINHSVYKAWAPTQQRKAFNTFRIISLKTTKKKKWLSLWRAWVRNLVPWNWWHQGFDRRWNRGSEIKDPTHFIKLTCLSSQKPGATATGNLTFKVGRPSWPPRLLFLQTCVCFSHYHRFSCQQPCCTLKDCWIRWRETISGRYNSNSDAQLGHDRYRTLRIKGKEPGKINGKYRDARLDMVHFKGRGH